MMDIGGFVLNSIGGKQFFAVQYLETASELSSAHQAEQDFD